MWYKSSPIRGNWAVGGKCGGWVFRDLFSSRENRRLYQNWLKDAVLFDALGEFF